MKPAGVAESDRDLRNREETNRSQRVAIDRRPAGADALVEQRRVGRQPKVHGGSDEDSAKYPEPGEADAPADQQEQTEEQQPSHEPRGHRGLIVMDGQAGVEDVLRMSPRIGVQIMDAHPRQRLTAVRTAGSFE